MFRKTIAYTDYNGVNRTEDFYFNLSKAELLKLQLGHKGGYQQYLQRCFDTDDVPELLKIFEELIDMSYGIKDETGKKFVKSKDLTEEFKQTEAYSEMFVEFLTVPDAAQEFFTKIMPKDIQDRLFLDDEVNEDRVARLAATMAGQESTQS
jgi:hypothetical protein